MSKRGKRITPKRAHPEDTGRQAVIPPVAQTKKFRQDLDKILQDLKSRINDTRNSRERNLAVTKIQESIMWLGMDLKAMKEEGVGGCENPYPQSYNPDSPTIEPTADGLKL